MAEYLRNQQSQVSTLLELLHVRAKHFLNAPFQEPQTGLLLSAPHPPAPLPPAVLSFFLIIIFQKCKKYTESYNRDPHSHRQV